METCTVFTVMLCNTGTEPLEWGVVIGASLAAAVIDLRCRRIPNALVAQVDRAGVS